MPKLFEIAFHGAAIGMSLVGLEGRFMRVNSALCRLLGYSEEELLDRTQQEITHPDDWEADLASVEQMLRGEINAYQMDKRYVRKNGSAVWVLMTVSMLAGDHELPRCFFSQVQDITARKETEGSLKASAEENHRLYEELRHATMEVTKLQAGLVTICAWTKQIRVGQEWKSVEEFLREDLHLKLSHGVTDEVVGRMVLELNGESEARPRDGREP